jgi:hypothetical protein
LLLALAACAGGSSPSPSVPADSPSPSQSTPSTPASPSDSPSPSPSPSPSEAEPSPSIDPALSKDGKFRAQSTLTEDPRTTRTYVYVRSEVWNGMNTANKSLEELKQQNEMGFKELYDVFGLELNEDKLYDIIYGKYKWQYDKFMALLDSEHKDTRDLVNFFLKHGRWGMQYMAYRGMSVSTAVCYEMISDYIRNDKNDLDIEKFNKGSVIPVDNNEQSGNNFILYNLDNPKLPKLEIISACAYTEALAEKYRMNYNRGDEIFVLAEIDDTPVTYLFSLDENNDFLIEFLSILSDNDDVMGYYHLLQRY